MFLDCSHSIPPLPIESYTCQCQKIVHIRDKRQLSETNITKLGEKKFFNFFFFLFHFFSVFTLLVFLSALFSFFLFVFLSHVNVWIRIRMSYNIELCFDSSPFVQFSRSQSSFFLSFFLLVFFFAFYVLRFSLFR